MRSKEVVRIRSLSDVLELSLRFEDLEVTVSGVVEKGGSVRFKLNDSGLTEEQLSRLKDSFASAFLVPLEQSIDPTILAMGPSEIYQFLLSGVAASEIQQYQRRPLEQLINWGLLSKHTKWKGSCTDRTCKSHSQVVLDRSLTECPTCQGSLEWKSDEVYEENRKALAKVTKALIEKATGGKMNFPPHAFESHRFYRLTFRDSPDQTVCVCLNDRLNPAKIDVFQRAMLPVLVIHPQGLHRSPVIDPHGLAHAGLPYLLAARESRDEWKKVRTDCKALVQRLRQMEKERMLRASRHSHDYLTNKPAGYNDRNFEADVYNLLRSVFAFTVKWGGPNKPDGFSSLVYFPQNALAAPAKFNWSYDAKYSDTRYSFAITEFRQMFDYISILHRPKGLQSVGNRYDAHAIITNSMNETAMRGAADYLWTEHRLGNEWPDFVLLFVRDTFIRRLWELVRDNETGLEQRGTYLAEFFVRAIKESVKDGYCLFEEQAAETLVHEVMSQAPLQDPVDARKVRFDLKKKANGWCQCPVDRVGRDADPLTCNCARRGQLESSASRTAGREGR